MRLGGCDDILCVVGDASQTIYSFTSATSRYLLDCRAVSWAYTVKLDPRPPFPFAGGGGVGEPPVGAPSASDLEPRVVGAAAGADVSAWPRRGWSGSGYADDEQEAAGIAEDIRDPIEKDGVPPSEIGVLFRTNAQSGGD